MQNHIKIFTKNSKSKLLNQNKPIVLWLPTIKENIFPKEVIKNSVRQCLARNSVYLYR